MEPLDKPFLTKTELRRRGWTNTLVERFLPTPDGQAPVNHWKNYRGQDIFASVKVWNVEQTEAFAQAFMKSWRGRMRGQNPEQVLADLRSCPAPAIPPHSRDDFRLMTRMAAASSAIEDARSRGHRTPHK